MSAGAPPSEPVAPVPVAAAGRVGVAFWLRCALAVVVRPSLWWSALRVWGRAAPLGWWRRPPFVPIPDPAFLGFRFETAYGHTGRPAVRDFVAYLGWVRDRG